MYCFYRECTIMSPASNCYISPFHWSKRKQSLSIFRGFKVAALMWPVQNKKFPSEDMASRLQRLDVDLEKCYENDVDRALLPEKVREISILFFLWELIKLRPFPTFVYLEEIFNTPQNNYAQDQYGFEEDKLAITGHEGTVIWICIKFIFTFRAFVQFWSAISDFVWSH